MIKNIGESASIYGGAGIDYVENTGEEAYINLGDDDDELLSYASHVLAKCGNGDDAITNFGDESTISGGNGIDYIENYGDYSSLAGDAGEDFIYSGGNQSTLNGGEDNDVLYNEGVYAYLIGGKGNDTLYNEGDHVTLSGGSGNDYIYNDGGRHTYYKFGKSDGKDMIYGFNNGDTIEITSGTHKTAKSGKNVIITVGKAKVTLQGAADKEINIISSSGEASTVNYSSASADLLWFAKENDFVTENNLSSLIQSNSAEYTPYKFSDSMKLQAEKAFTPELSFAREK